MSRNAFVPMTWITSDLSGEALRTLILISTFANGETGKCNVRNPKLASILGKSDRSVRNDISSIVKAGFMSIENGDSRDRILTIETPEWFQRPGRKTSGLGDTNPEEKLPGQPGRKTSAYPEEKLPRNPEEKLPGPNKNTILEHNFQHSEKSESVSEESEPGRFSEDCRSALSDLGQKPQPIPAEIKRMVTAVGAEGWIGQVAFQEISMSDWRIAETLRILQARGGNKGPNYAWTIFRGLPAEPPKPSANGQAVTQGKPKESLELIKAKAGLATARRLLPRGESTPEEVAKYEKRVEEALRKAETA